MNPRRAVFAAVAALVIAAAVTAIVLYTGPLEADELDAGSVEVTDGRAREYASVLTGPSGNEIATAVTTVRESEGGRAIVQFSLEHRDGTAVDSLYLRLQAHDTAALLPSIAFEVPSGFKFPPLRYRQLRSADGISLTVPDLGFFGESTIFMSFLVPGVESGFGPPQELRVGYEFDMHEKGILGDRYKGAGDMAVTLE